MTPEQQIIDILAYASRGYWPRILEAINPTGGELPAQQFPIVAEPRKWVHVNFYPFCQKPNTLGIVASIIAVRTDGFTFHVDISIPADMTPEQALREADQAIPRAIALLQTYRDCSCGIVGMRKTGEKDEDGNYIEVPIMNPCLTHPVEAAQ